MSGVAREATAAGRTLGVSPEHRASAASPRVCSRCKEPKPLDEFRLDSRGYVRSRCIPCSREENNEWREKGDDLPGFMHSRMHNHAVDA